MAEDVSLSQYKLVASFYEAVLSFTRTQDATKLQAFWKDNCPNKRDREVIRWYLDSQLSRLNTSFEDKEFIHLKTAHKPSKKDVKDVENHISGLSLESLKLTPNIGTKGLFKGYYFGIEEFRTHPEAGQVVLSQVQSETKRLALEMATLDEISDDLRFDFMVLSGSNLSRSVSTESFTGFVAAVKTASLILSKLIEIAEKIQIHDEEVRKKVTKSIDVAKKLLKILNVLKAI